MNSIYRFEPEHYTPRTVLTLPKDKPLGIFDLDGTLTRDEGELLLASFVRSNVIGEAIKTEGARALRHRLIALFDAKLEGRCPLGYEDYLKKLGNDYALMLYRSGLKRPDVIGLGREWFQEDGFEEVLPYAIPMSNVLEKYRCARVMMTGAPLEVADPIAAHIGFEHVFSMTASVNQDGSYNGKIRLENNTGVLTHKGAICREIHKNRVTVVGAGNTQSDTALMETAYLKGEDNPSDMRGFALLMNTGQIGDEIVERFMKASGHRHTEFRYFCIPRTPEVEPLIQFFRTQLKSTLEMNGYGRVVDEIEEKRPLTIEEREALKREREQNPDCWQFRQS